MMMTTFLEQLTSPTRAVVQKLLKKKFRNPGRLHSEVDRHVDALRRAALRGRVNSEKAVLVGRACHQLMESVSYRSGESIAIAQVALAYFIDPNDAIPDFDRPDGLDDDLEVLRAAVRVLGIDQSNEMGLDA